MRSALKTTPILLLLVLAAGRASADRIVLENGGALTGRIEKESDREIVIVLEDGMRMNVRRDRIRRIEREAPQQRETPAEPEPVPIPTPEPEPPDAGVPEPAGAEAGASPPKPSPRGGGLFETPPESDWELRYGRYPELGVAKLTRYRRYRYVSHSPLALEPDDPRFANVVREHGHGGALAVWTFEYMAMDVLRFGDRVKFVAEITSPESAEQPLIRFRLGPEPTADRVAILLLERDGRRSRIVTTTAFDSGDFRQIDVEALDRKALPVRTWAAGYVPLGTTWLAPSDSEFLGGLRSPFGESLRVRLERCRFRADWFAKPAAERPALDPDLLQRNAVRPLALPGRPAASPELILKLWGTPEAVRQQVARLREEVRNRLSRIGVKPGMEFYVEQDQIGRFGKMGLTIVTRRHRFTKEYLDSLLPR